MRLEKVSLESGSWSDVAVLPGASPALGRRLVSFRDHVVDIPPRDRVRSIPGLGTRRLHRWSRWLQLEDELP